MAQNSTFRAALFGGYNREDVDEYIKNMEHEIESVKLLHQKEKIELIRRAEESEGELALVREELEKARRQLNEADEPGEAECPAESREAEERVVSGEMEILARMQETLDKLEKENQELKERWRTGMTCLIKIP